MKRPKSDLYKLTDVWYGKLKKSGFNDIEKDEFTLKAPTSRVFEYYTTEETWKAKEAYYRMAEHFLNDYKFDNRVEKLIWEYHSNGISIRDIGKILKKAKIKSISVAKSPIGLIIKRLKSSMYNMYLAPKEEYHE